MTRSRFAQPQPMRRDAGRSFEARRDDYRAPAPAPRWGVGRPDDRGRFAQPPPMPLPWFQFRR